MTETLLYLIAGVLILAVLRSILGVVWRGVEEFFGAANTPPPSQQQQTRSAPSRDTGKPDFRKPEASTPEALKPETLRKDPVCGTFLPASMAVTKTVNGQTIYFCSAACRDKFKR